MQSLGSLIEFQEGIKTRQNPSAHVTLTINMQSFGCLTEFQEDIEITRSHATISHSVTSH